MRRAFCLNFIIVMAACSQSKVNTNDKVSGPSNHFKLTQWVIGSWASESSDALSYEFWHQINDSTLAGRSYSVSNGDTVSSEYIMLVERNGQISYVPTVREQNDDLPVEFKLKSITEMKMVFENPDHDFPQRISYEKLSGDSLIAEIAGMVKGSHRAVQFPMRRLK